MQIAQRSPACSGRLDKTLGNEFADFVAAAMMRQFTADFFKHDIHVRLGAFVESTQFASLPRLTLLAFVFIVDRARACK